MHLKGTLNKPTSKIYKQDNTSNLIVIVQGASNEQNEKSIN